MVVPLFIELRYLGLLNSYAALIIPEIAMPFGVFLLRQAFLQLPRELEEAAFVDGAGHIRTFFTLVLPLSKPAIATVAVFSFMGSWNNFLWPLVVINSPDLMTLPLGLSSLSSRFVTDWNLLLAGATISVLPIVAVFLFAQRYILQGVAMSGLKG
jgi:multiple sugar transport system permease protein